jgi:hypothetical protein
VVTVGFAVGLREFVFESPVAGYHIAWVTPVVDRVTLLPEQMNAESPASICIALPPVTVTTTVSVIKQPIVLNIPTV